MIVPETILVFFTLLVGFYMAWTMGANDVANTMGTVVGSKALTLKKAVMLAIIFEFSGAFFLGSHVSQTLQKGIVDPSIFHIEPMTFVIGMLSALLAAALWLNIASHLGLPVSTTHAIVGAILGFGTIIGGIKAIYWGQVGFIASSWIISPFLSGFIAYFTFTLLQYKILYTLNPLESTKRLIPFLVFFAFFIFSLSCIFNGSTYSYFSLTFPLAFLTSILVGTFAFIISCFLVKRIPTSPTTLKVKHQPQQLISLEKAEKHLQRSKLISHGERKEKISKILKDLNEITKMAKKETEIINTSSEYLEVEKKFIFLQIISAALIAFAHGTNDVANAIGPVAGVIHSLKAHAIIENSVIPPWILILGGIGIIFGIATLGWKVIETVGKKITQFTPTRGFVAEFSAACTILLASKLGLPISTTHALIGAVLGVGLARGINAINLKILRDIVLSWIVTIPICAFLSISIYYLIHSIFQF